MPSIPDGANLFGKIKIQQFNADNKDKTAIFSNQEYFFDIINTLS